MVEQIYKNIYRIHVPLEGNPLKEINSYFIKGGERDLLIDTGFRRDSCRIPLEDGLREIGSEPNRRDVYVTHLHADHSGLADQFVGEGGALYVSRIDLNFALKFFGHAYADKDARFREEGFTLEMMEEIERSSPSSIYIMKNWDLPCVRAVDEGDRIQVGDYRFRVVMTPGHTPGNTMLWEENHRIMFTGDNILFNITPNITYWEGVQDSLGNYLESLQRVKIYPVEISFPGHRQTGDYHTRIDELLIHHEKRIAEARKVATEQPGLRALDIAGKMSWRIRARSWEEFPLVQKRFAVGECISHLDYLMLRGKITRHKGDDGMWVYGPVGW